MTIFGAAPGVRFQGVSPYAGLHPVGRRPRRRGFKTKARRIAHETRIDVNRAFMRRVVPWWP